jgi:hypothetical protein
MSIARKSTGGAVERVVVQAKFADYLKKIP